MPVVESELALLRLPRLAALATNAWPAWLWSADARRIVWANAAGAAIFGAPSANELAQRRFDPKNPVATQIARLAATMSSGGAPRLERLRGLGAGFGRVLMCACSRVVLPDGTGGLLVAATEPAGPALALVERVRRLFPDQTRARAVFTADGNLLYATDAALKRLGGAATLSALGLGALAVKTLEAGSASGDARLGDDTFEATLLRLGEGVTRVVAVAFSSAAPSEAIATPKAAEPPRTETISPPNTEPPSAAPPPLDMPVSAQPPPRSVAQDEPAAERRHPLRFVWQMDAEGRFFVGSDEFTELVGPRTMASFGRLWSEIATDLKLDPESHVARAVATQETWSGIIVSWPVDESADRLQVEMSGLPVFDRDRKFRGYRGFGVARDIARINELARVRRARPIGFMPASETPHDGADDSPPAPQTPATPVETEAGASAASDVTAAANVVPFRSGAPADAKPPPLSPVERKAFGELAQELTARLRGAPNGEPTAPAETVVSASPDTPEGSAKTADAEPPDEVEITGAAVPPLPAASSEPVLLDRVPIGVLVYRHDGLLYANRHFLEMSGYDSLDALAAAGGFESLFAEPAGRALTENGTAQSLSITKRNGDRLPVEGRMFTVPWSGASALALVLINGQAEERHRTIELALAAAQSEIRELKSFLDTVTDGVLVLDGDGRVLTANGSAEALFGKSVGELDGLSLDDLLAPESLETAHAYFEKVSGGTNMLHDAVEVTGRAREGQYIPLSMMLARLSGERFSAAFRDATVTKKNEEDLRNAKREAQRATAAKAEFLAKVSHEIRTPLNAITGFAEVIMAERFGPVGNERYRDYLKDIHAAGIHLVSLLNDLLDLSKVETGELPLNFANVNLNDLTQQCVGIMQPQANRASIIIRTSLAPGLPRVVADERSLRQIVLNLVANAIKFTGPGGQAIVTTVASDNGEAILRVRDNGAGMSEKDVETALAPFRQTATSGSWGSGGTRLGLPLTKALAEANRAHFSIKSAPNQGTLLEIVFPPTRVLAAE
jgi:PAS domain S-box-containing protein